MPTDRLRSAAANDRSQGERNDDRVIGKRSLGQIKGVTDEGRRVLVDRRAAARLPGRFGLTVRGLGPLKHLDLELEPEDWGELLYT